MLADKTNIENFIPQRAPMRMIHDLIEVTNDRAVSAFVIEENNIFVSNGVFTEPGLIENIAQTAAAHAGYLYQQNGVTVPVGFIAAIKDLKIYSLPLLDTSIETTITVTNRVFDVTIVKGVIDQNGKTLCTCEMKIFTKS
jgi:predicted hotdog family 3-hydroxylacyl-ACP dehydratase